jgi:hypothetical protein
MNSLVLYFSRFDLFAGGLMGFFSLFAFFYIFSFTGVRGKFEHPHQKALELLLPVFVAALFLNFMGLPPVVVGFIVILVYLGFAKNALKLNNREWSIQAVYIFCLLGIFGLLDPWSRNILFIGYLIYNFTLSEKKLKEKESKKEKKD